MRHSLAVAACLFAGALLLFPGAHAENHDKTSEELRGEDKPPLSEAIPDNTVDGFGVEDLNEDELGADIGAVRRVVVIDGSGSSGPTPYQLVVTGEIQKAEGDIEGFPATINDKASINGEIATGQVRSGVDAYYVYGEIRRIALGDPDAASVYVDGESVGVETLAEPAMPE